MSPQQQAARTHTLAPRLPARRCISVLVVALCAFLLSTVASAETWKGKEVTKDGARYIMNPAMSMEKPTTVELEELWRLGGDTDDEDQFFGVISQILVDPEGDVYVLDTQLSQVNIYADDGAYVNTIGREGEGPGEFKMPAGMFLTSNGEVAVVQTHPGKIVLLTKDGEPAGEHPIPKSDDGGFILLLKGHNRGDNTVLLLRKDDYSQGFSTDYRLVSIADDGSQLAQYCTSTRSIDMAARTMTDSDWDTIDRRWEMGNNGKVYAALSYGDYRIHVWNPDGSVDRIIEREFEHRKRSQEEIDEVKNLMDLFVKRFGLSVNINEWTKDIESFYVRDDGSIWVLNANGMRDRPEGTIGMFDVFDSKGRFVRQVTLKGEGDPKTDGYFFIGDRVYVVTDFLQAAVAMQAGGASADIGEEEPEPMAVIAYKLSGDAVTSR